MIILKISDKLPDHKAIIESIQSMCLRHRIEYTLTTETPIMIAYGKEYKGMSSIMEGIAEIEILVQSWYECRCDKYESD